jgi:hypothetical protein
MEIENLGEIARLARDFVYVPVNWKVYEDLKEFGGVSNEFVVLCEAVEKYFGPPPYASR